QVQQTGGYWKDYQLMLGADGSAYFSSDAPDPRIEKLNFNGNIDTSYGDNGLATVPGSYAMPYAVTADGKVMVECGKDNPIFWPGQYSAVMLAADGSIDSSFHNGTSFVNGDNVSALPLADGSLLVSYSSDDASVTPNFQIE